METARAESPAGRVADDRKESNAMSTIPHDESEDLELPPFARELTGETSAALDMHVEARVALLNCLATDPEVKEMFLRWTLESEIGRRGAAVGLATEDLDDTARALGFDGVHALIAAIDESATGTITVTLDGVDGAATEEITKRIEETLRIQLTEAVGRLDSWVAAIDESVFVPLFEEASSLVRDRWKLPWPWLAWDLVHAWVSWLGAAPFNLQATVNNWAESVELDAPAPDITFEKRPGETIGEALLRCVEEVLAPLLSATDAARLPTGRRTASEIVEKYVGWWYQNRIGYKIRNDRAGSVRSLAGGDYDGTGPIVRHGIKRAEAWLGAVAWTWNDDVPLEK